MPKKSNFNNRQNVHFCFRSLFAIRQQHKHAFGPFRAFKNGLWEFSFDILICKHNWFIDTHLSIYPEYRLMLSAREQLLRSNQPKQDEICWHIHITPYIVIVIIIIILIDLFRCTQNIKYVKRNYVIKMKFNYCQIDHEVEKTSHHRTEAPKFYVSTIYP